MALTTVGAFAAGFVTGWAARSMLGPTREAIVQVVTAAHKVGARVRRGVAERAEWLEDMLAEGKARYDATVAAVAVDSAAPPHVDYDEVQRRRERAA